MRLITLFITLTISCFSIKCEALSLHLTKNEYFVKTPVFLTDSIQKDSIKVHNHQVKPKRRLIAAFLCVTLGPFGMHRLYLGTEPRVAAAYTLTLGGGIGLVPVIDLFHIVFSRDISKFKDNDKFLMWTK